MSVRKMTRIMLAKITPSTKTKTKVKTSLSEKLTAPHFIGVVSTDDSASITLPLMVKKLSVAYSQRVKAVTLRRRKPHLATSSPCVLMEESKGARRLCQYREKIVLATL